MRKLSRRAASIALAAVMLFTTAGVSQKKVEAASTGKLSVTGYQDYNDAQKILKEVNKYRSIFQKQVRIEDPMESFQKVSTRRSSMKTVHNPQELHRSRS